MKHLIETKRDAWIFNSAIACLFLLAILTFPK